MAKDLTPKEFKCAMSMACPAVLELEPEDLTPEHLRCHVSVSCPAVVAHDGDLVIISKRADALAEQLGKGVGPDEYAIVIERGLLDNVLKCKCQANVTAKGDVVSANASSIERGAETLSLSMALGIGRAVADCCDPPVIRGIFSSLNEHFPEVKFELDDDYGALVTFLNEGSKPDERTTAGERG